MRSDDIVWEQSESGVRLRVPLKNAHGIGGFLARAANAGTAKEIELEEIGAFVWSLCDGKATSNAISSKLCEKYKLLKPEADVSLAKFLEMLSARGCIVFVK
jgi:hypothetical protein